MGRRHVWFAAMVVLAACEGGVLGGADCERASECSAPLTCSFGRCRTECREARDCAEGAECLLDASGAGACALPDADHCDPVRFPCANGLECIEGACRQSCAALACAPGSTCVAAGDALVCRASNVTPSPASPPVPSSLRALAASVSSAPFNCNGGDPSPGTAPGVLARLGGDVVVASRPICSPSTLDLAVPPGVAVLVRASPSLLSRWSLALQATSGTDASVYWSAAASVPLDATRVVACASLGAVDARDLASGMIIPATRSGVLIATIDAHTGALVAHRELSVSGASGDTLGCRAVVQSGGSDWALLVRAQTGAATLSWSGTGVGSLPIDAGTAAIVIRLAPSAFEAGSAFAATDIVMVTDPQARIAAGPAGAVFIASATAGRTSTQIERRELDGTATWSTTIDPGGVASGIVAGPDDVVVLVPLPATGATDTVSIGGAPLSVSRVTPAVIVAALDLASGAARASAAWTNADASLVPVARDADGTLLTLGGLRSGASLGGAAIVTEQPIDLAILRHDRALAPIEVLHWSDPGLISATIPDSTFDSWALTDTGLVVGGWRVDGSADWAGFAARGLFVVRYAAH